MPTTISEAVEAELTPLVEHIDQNRQREDRSPTANGANHEPDRDAEWDGENDFHAPIEATVRQR